MSTSLNLYFPPEDLAKFQAQMQRRHELLKTAPDECVRIGFIAACKSLRASTKTAPQRRKVRVSRSGRKVRVDRNRLFVAEGMDRATGALKNILIWAPDLATAKLSPKARIKKYGLAKASWGWAMHRLFQAPAPDARLASPAGTLDVTRIYDRATGYAEAGVANRLNYISKALSGGKGPAVSTAMARAAENMRGATDAIINKATREAGY